MKNQETINATITIYVDRPHNSISRNLLGHFTEHCSNLIYGGMYDPGHPLSDQDGFRRDVLQALREVKVPTLRYPGGNFVSNYHWMDGIGPKEKRPRKFDYAWLTEESNEFGTVEFIQLCRKVGAEPYICVNMGSGTAEEAMHWVEFCNSEANTYYANLRREMGYEEPFHVKYWGLGNEMYGDWQFGKSSAEDYAKKALDFAKAMKWMDPSIELVASGYDLGSDWNYTVAQVLKPLVKHIAIHHYSIGYGIFREEDYVQCMYIPEYLDKLTRVAAADIVAGTNDALTEIKVAWDEWNTYAWDMKKEADDSQYTMQTALMTGLILHSFIRNSDQVEIGGYSPFVNGRGALSVKEDGILKRSQYSVFQLMAEALDHGDRYLNSYTECDSFSLPEVIDFSNRLPEPMFSLDAKSLRRTVRTPLVDCVAATDEAGKEIVLSIINKHPELPCQIDLNVLGGQIDLANAKCKTIYNSDLKAANTSENPDQVVLRESKLMVGEGRLLLPEHSVNLLVFHRAEDQ